MKQVSINHPKSIDEMPDFIDEWPYFIDIELAKYLEISEKSRTFVSRKRGKPSQRQAKKHLDAGTGAQNTIKMKTINEAIKVAEELRKKLIEIGYEQIDVKSSRLLKDFWQVSLTDSEDTLTLTPLMLETCIMYSKLQYYSYYIWLNPEDGRLTFTIR